MNDTTYFASVLDAHRAEDLRREVALLAQHAERDAESPSTPAARHASAAASVHLRPPHDVRRHAMTTRRRGEGATI